MSNKIKETFTVHGMSCTGCETLIEKALNGLDGTLQVKANFTKNQVTVVFDSGKISFGKMRAAVKKAGYTMEKAQHKLANKSDEKKDKPLSSLQFIGIAVILLALYTIINRTVGFNFIPEVNSSMGYGVLFVVGLLTSLHCVAMCGGINISQCVSGGKAAAGFKENVRPSLLYNLGRVTSYTVIGGIIGAIGSVISFSGWARGLIAILSGLFMVIMGLSMTGFFPWINRVTPRLPRIFREKAGSAGKGRGPYIVGLLNGLMPCGPLQAMQIYALGTGSMAAGALSMFFFSLGTLPLMFGLGAVVTMLGSRFTKK
ncbi:MAG: sulfite exporter TauE/SafE family protein, partial [Bacillota bacterium]|nr:sulfite exporter TauE/SafE family protein [Bacillota bacterium]